MEEKWTKSKRSIGQIQANISNPAYLQLKYNKGKREGAEKIFDAIMSEYFSNLVKSINLHIQEA